MGSPFTGATKTKAHVVVVALPAQGHVNPLLKLARLLHSKGSRITFVNCHIFCHHVLLSKGPDVLRSTDDFQFKTINDGAPVDNPIDAAGICSSVQRNCGSSFRDLMAELMTASGSPESPPPVSCILTDGFMTCTHEVANELGIPLAVFWPMAAVSLVGLLHSQDLVDRGLVPLKDRSELETPVDWIPGMKGIRLKDLVSYIRTTEPDDVTMFDFCSLEAQRTSKTPVVIINTFDELEREALDALATIVPRIYTIGPFPLALDLRKASVSVTQIDACMWEADGGCLEWLDARPLASVVYVNFGSVTRLTVSQLLEFAWGIARSKCSFFWVVRPNIVRGGEERDPSKLFLSEEFLAETKDRCRIASWCPQEQVLSHPSIGAFLTHNGWNSTAECVSAGVPMICWPYFADQQTNCHYACAKWGVGVEIPEDVKREDVGRMVREVMEGEKGREMRRRAREWKERAMAAAMGGSSSCNLQRLISELHACT